MRRASLLGRAATSLSDAVAETDMALPEVERRGTDQWLGKIVDGRYRVEEVLGRGGMGVVYKITHQRMGKIAAMKVLHSEMAKNPEVVARFQREAEAVSRLAHPNTVQVFDFGAMDGALYLVMEYVRGQDLGALLDRDGPMSFKNAAPLLGQICGSLEEAHHLGVIHRDLKPENILVSRTHSGQDFIKVLDFGLAKISEADDDSSVTSAGSIVGTPYYMSPEQIRAEEEVDHRADIYSLGALMYRLVTADNAFNAKTPVGVLTKHLTDDVEPPSERHPHLQIPKKLDAIIQKCMAKEPVDRYQSVRSLLEDIEQLFVETSSDTSDLRRPPTSWLAEPNDGTVPVAALFEQEVDHGIQAEMRLRREDLDNFETQLRRKRLRRVILLPLLLLGAMAGVLYWAMLRPPPIHTQEQEPNNDLASATRIAPGTEVHGYIGKRESKTQPDRDFYELSVAPNADGSEVVSVTATPPPNLDISIDLYNTSGKLMRHVNTAGVGETEHLRRWRTSSGVVVSVAGVLDLRPGVLPTENVSDTYTLTVQVAPTDDRLESEPNDSRADANVLTLATPLSGFLDEGDDVDVYRITAQAGRHTLLISGAPNLAVEWRLGDEQSWRDELKATISLEASSVISIRERLGKERIGEAPSYTIDVRPAPN